MSVHRLEMVVNDALQGTAAYRTVVGYVVGAHAAVEGWTIDALALITASLKDSYGGVVVLVLIRIDGCRYDGILGQHVGPLALEVAEGGEVLVPRLYIGIVILGVHLVVEILVTEAAKAMAELMDKDGQRACMVGRGDVVAVIHSAAAILRAVGQHDDMLVGYCGEVVAGLAQIDYSYEALHIEEIEECAAGGLLPHSLGRLADATLLRLCPYGYHVEAVFV